MRKLQLEDFDLGRPTHPDIRIVKMGEEVSNKIKPYAVDNGLGNWLYNISAAKMEAQFLGKRLPTSTELFSIVKCKDDIKNIAFAGTSSGSNDKSDSNSIGYYQSYWTTTKEDETEGFNKCLFMVADEFILSGNIYISSEHHSYAVSARCLKQV